MESEFCFPISLTCCPAMDPAALAPPGPPAPHVPQDPPASNEMINSVHGVLPCAVTVSFVTKTRTVYHSGVTIMAEDNYTVIFTKSLEKNGKKTTDYDKVYIFFHVAMGIGGEVSRPQQKEARLLCSDEDFMVFVVNKDHQQPDRKEIPLGAIPLDPEAARYPKVFTIGAMSGTKLLYLKSIGPDDKILGRLGIYEGSVNTHSCTAWQLESRDISDGTDRFFKFSCIYKDGLVNLKNIDNKEEDHTAKSILGAPVVLFNGEMVGTVYSVSTSSDDKYGVHTAAMISQIIAMCDLELDDIDDHWDFKERLRRVYQKRFPNVQASTS